MEILSRAQERQNPSSTTSPNTNPCRVLHLQTPPQSPKPISTPETISHQTTFIQADTTTFKQLVQALTGTPQTAKKASSSIPPIKTGQKKQSSSKLYERRSSSMKMKNGLMISPNLVQNYRALSRKDEALSPSMLDFPLLALSPVTPLLVESCPFGKSPLSFEGNSSSFEEEKAIAEKGFYLHPSPRTGTPIGSKPLLLPLFPVTSPRVSDSSY